MWHKYITHIRNQQNYNDAMQYTYDTDARVKKLCDCNALDIRHTCLRKNVI